MGGIRSSPQLTKLTISQKKINTTYALKQMCGWRKYQEDAFIIEDQLKQNKQCSLFAIFDGHGGPDCSIFAARHFSQELQQHPEFRKYQYTKCLKDTFFKIDELMLSEQGRKQITAIRKEQFEKGNMERVDDIESVGCTALVCLLTPNFVYVANAGDCRAIASVKGELQQLSVDHRPSNAVQARRIKDAGGWIEKYRLNGDLLVSRGFGDFPYKRNKYQKIENQMVTANPQIKQILRRDIDYILMGCDGIWQTKSSQQMKDWIDNHLKQHSMQKTLQMLLDELVSKSKEEPKGMDNMTAILIKLNQ